MKYQLLTALFVTGLLISCNTTRNPRRDYPDRRTNYPRQEKESKEESERIYPFSALGIPKGHLPPPGECKIWIPRRPAGQQGPPQSCSAAFRNVPPGAWVITHESTRYQVKIFNRTRHSIVDEIRYYLLGE